MKWSFSKFDVSYRVANVGDQKSSRLTTARHGWDFKKLMDNYQMCEDR